MSKLKSIPLGKFKGKKVSRFPVFAKQHALFHTTTMMACWVIAHSAAEAADFVKAELADAIINGPFAWRPVEITVRGPRGGKTVRHMGHESIVWQGMQNERIRAKALAGSATVQPFLPGLDPETIKHASAA